MRGRPLNIATIGRAIGFIALAAAIGATAVHFQHAGAERASSHSASPTTSDPLAPELARCQTIGMAATDDAACEAAWAESRRRFFAPGITNQPEGPR
jgi:conjugative transfer region protein TrbK